MNAEGGIIELHMDAPGGKLLGQTAFIGDAAAEANGGALSFAEKPVPLDVKPTEGVHDIYLGFKNPNANQGGTLMIIMGTVFKTGDANNNRNVQADIPKTDLNDYTGKYKMTGLPFPYIEISVQDGKLMMKAGDQGGAIAPTGEADKFDANGKATLLFIRDEKKKVFKPQMEAMGFKFDGIKE